MHRNPSKPRTGSFDRPQIAITPSEKEGAYLVTCVADRRDKIGRLFEKNPNLQLSTGIVEIKTRTEGDSEIVELTVESPGSMRSDEAANAITGIILRHLGLRQSDAEEIESGDEGGDDDDDYPSPPFAEAAVA